MPNKRAAIKALRQTHKRNQRNESARTTVKALLKLTRRTIKAGSAQELPQLLRDTTQALAKAAQRRVISRNTAARLTSRLWKQARKK